jgi:hypothetical protein
MGFTATTGRDVLELAELALNTCPLDLDNRTLTSGREGVLLHFGLLWATGRPQQQQ